MPMKTTFVTGQCTPIALHCCSTCHTCSRISPALRFPLNPICPVAQNVQPIAQPTCDETHTVTRPFVAPPAS